MQMVKKTEANHLTIILSMSMSNAVTLNRKSGRGLSILCWQMHGEMRDVTENLLSPFLHSSLLDNHALALKSHTAKY
jgi:hypothetical protein